MDDGLEIVAPPGCRHGCLEQGLNGACARESDLDAQSNMLGLSVEIFLTLANMLDV